MQLETWENNQIKNNPIVVLCHAEKKKKGRDISMWLTTIQVYEIWFAANEDLGAMMITSCSWPIKTIIQFTL